MSDLAEEPRLHFFRSRPTDLLTRPPLASSLQSFESSLFLVALQRYPHALTACVFAIESVLKSAFDQPPQGGDNLQKLFERARNESAQLQMFPADELDALRKTRNRIVHYGFSPKDDRLTAGMLLRPAMPFLRASYGSLFGFSLDDALLSDIARHIRVAENVCQGAEPHSELYPTYCFDGLGYLIRWKERDALMTDWEIEADTSNAVLYAKLDAVARLKNGAVRHLEPSWEFNCPICEGTETFICQLDESELHDKRIRLVWGVCAECEFMVRRDAIFLADALCEDQVVAQSARILKEYGIW